MTEIRLKDPGFVGNASDGASCMHACMQMVMRTRDQGPVFTFEEMDRIMRRRPGFYSWPYAIHRAIAETGFEVRSVDLFDTEKFVANGEAYLREFYDAEAAEVQIEHADMPVILEDAANYLVETRIDVRKAVPTAGDVEKALKEGWYVVPLVNSRVLDRRKGYAGHFIFIYGCDDDEIIFHDPGSCVGQSEPRPDRRVSWDLFEKAWASPRVETKSMTCFRAEKARRDR